MGKEGWSSREGPAGLRPEKRMGICLEEGEVHRVCSYRPSEEWLYVSCLTQWLGGPGAPPCCQNWCLLYGQS
jgi:hypothetical protein